MRAHLHVVLIAALLSSSLQAGPCGERLKNLSQFKVRTGLVAVAVAALLLGGKVQRDKAKKAAQLQRVREWLEVDFLSRSDAQFVPELVEILVDRKTEMKVCRHASISLCLMDKSVVLPYLPRLIAAIDPQPGMDNFRSEFVAIVIQELGPEANVAQSRLVWALTRTNLVTTYDCASANRYVTALEKIGPLTPESAKLLFEFWKQSKPVTEHGYVVSEYMWLWRDLAALLTSPNSPVLEQAFTELLEERSTKKVRHFDLKTMIRYAAKGKKRVEKLLDQSDETRARFQSLLSPMELKMIEESWQAEKH